jgi:glycosyltransferase involved in cell wall biosynthesis
MIGRYGSSWEETPETTVMNRVTKILMQRLAGGHNVMLATGAGDERPARNMHWLFATAISREEVESVHPVLDRDASRPLQVAYVGRLSPEKGVRYLVEAMARIEADRRSTASPPPVMLTLVGDGPERALLETLVRQRGCGDVVTFAGQLSRGPLLVALQQMDVCVLPSLTESFCKARLDAMLCGVPVLTTPVGFGAEIVGADGERGWIVPTADAGALAESLTRIGAEPRDWWALRRRCRAYVEARTLEAWVGRIGEICSTQWNVPLVGGKLQA